MTSVWDKGSLGLGKIFDAIAKQKSVVSGWSSALSAAGSSISVTAMIQLQMAYNVFEQVSNLGSTSVSVFNQICQTAIRNIKQ